MAEPKVVKVKNKETGMIHTVLSTHFATDHPDYELVEEKPAAKSRSKAKTAPKTAEKEEKTAKTPAKDAE